MLGNDDKVDVDHLIFAALGFAATA